ncbi:MAG: 3-dehydroquinate dehydratase [Bacillales bacterium]|nr:3-dehydroquinate dehydratase [Bacillales bacterium]
MGSFKYAHLQEVGILFTENMEEYFQNENFLKLVNNLKVRSVNIAEGCNMNKVLIVNGPNLNFLGKREPEVYGSTTLAELEESLKKFGIQCNFEIECFQSNVEGEIINRIYKAHEDGVIGIILNPGGYTHTSVAIHDCIAGIPIPVIEVHISNIHAREEFRHKSIISAVTAGQIIGFGVYGYELALIALKNKIKGV